MDNLVNNYYILRNLLRESGPFFRGSLLIDLYRHHNEYIFQFRKENTVLSISCYMDHSISFVFPTQKNKPGKGTHSFFKELAGKEIANSGVFANDRSFYLQFTGDYLLIFKLYGGHGNLILFEGQKVRSLLKPQFQQDHQKKPGEYHFPVTQNRDRYLKLTGQLKIPGKVIKQMFPAFSADFTAQLTGKGWYSLTPEEQWKKINEFISWLEFADYYIIKESSRGKNDPGIKLTCFEKPEVLYKAKKAGEALARFAAVYLREYELLRKKNALLDKLKQQRQKFHKSVNKANERLYHLENQAQYKNMADILMANLHRVHQGAGEATLWDFYRNKQIRIPLKAKLSPQENAARYYRKSKTQNIEVKKLKERIRIHKRKEEEIQKRITEIAQKDDLKKIRRLHKEQDQEQQSGKKDIHNLFRVFHYRGYLILAGKSARNNDLLITRFAGKNDLWLHARAQKGSHVIVRDVGKQGFPQPVIEQAARLAAYYSGGRGEEFCPVTYTLRKYVWKPKGADPGVVRFQYEKVVLVKPDAATDE